jgi:outer membrane protein assembly factor BamD (BamD/ComL family)
MKRLSFVVLGIAAPLFAQDVSGFLPDLPFTTAMRRDFQSRSGENRREDREYERGMSALDAHRWDRAIAAFQAVAERKGTDADAALYSR